MPGLGIKRTQTRPRAFEGPPVSDTQDHINPRDRRVSELRAWEGPGECSPAPIGSARNVLACRIH